MNAEPARPLRPERDPGIDVPDMTEEQRQALVQWIEHMMTLEPDPDEPTYRRIIEELNRHRSPDWQIPLPDDDEC